MKPAKIPKQIYDRALDMARPRSRSAQEYRDIALKEYTQGDTDKAVYYYQQAIKLSHEDPELQADLAQIYYEQGDYKKAKEYYHKALKSDENNIRILKGLSFTLHQMGYYNEAMYQYLKCLSLDKKDVDVLNNMGTLLYTMGKYDEAIGYYQRALAFDINDISTYENLAFIYYYLGNFTDAIGTLKRAQGLGLENARVLVLLGAASEGVGEKEFALECYRKAIEKDSNNGEAYLNLGRLLSVLEDYQEALKNGEVALALFKERENRQDMAIALWEIGWCYYNLGDWKNSIKASRKALDIEPSLLPVRFNLALALLCQGNQKEAHENYSEGIKAVSNPSDIKIYAINDLEKALRKTPGIPGGNETLQFLNEKYALSKESQGRKG